MISVSDLGAISARSRQVSFKYRPPKGWPDDIQFTNQLLWDEVPEGYHFFRDKIADPGSVRRSHRTRIERITSRKHPCFGEHGLFADEDIEVGAVLFDYTGHVRVVVGDEHDTCTSSYLLNLFTDEESSVFIDIDAAHSGNEARLLTFIFSPFIFSHIKFLYHLYLLGALR